MRTIHPPLLHALPLRHALTRTLGGKVRCDFDLPLGIDDQLKVPLASWFEGAGNKCVRGRRSCQFRLNANLLLSSVATALRHQLVLVQTLDPAAFLICELQLNWEQARGLLEGYDDGALLSRDLQPPLGILAECCVADVATCRLSFPGGRERGDLPVRRRKCGLLKCCKLKFGLAVHPHLEIPELPWLESGGNDHVRVPAGSQLHLCRDGVCVVKGTTAPNELRLGRGLLAARVKHPQVGCWGLRLALLPPLVPFEQYDHKQPSAVHDQAVLGVTAVGRLRWVAPCVGLVPLPRQHDSVPFLFREDPANVQGAVMVKVILERHPEHTIVRIGVAELLLQPCSPLGGPIRVVPFPLPTAPGVAQLAHLQVVDLLDGQQAVRVPVHDAQRVGVGVGPGMGGGPQQIVGLTPVDEVVPESPRGNPLLDVIRVEPQLHPHAARQVLQPLRDEAPVDGGVAHVHLCIRLLDQRDPELVCVIGVGEQGCRGVLALVGQAVVDDHLTPLAVFVEFEPIQPSVGVVGVAEDLLQLLLPVLGQHRDGGQEPAVAKGPLAHIVPADALKQVEVAVDLPGALPHHRVRVDADARQELRGVDAGVDVHAVLVPAPFGHGLVEDPVVRLSPCGGGRGGLGPVRHGRLPLAWNDGQGLAPPPVRCRHLVRVMLVPPIGRLPSVVALVAVVASGLVCFLPLDD
mmetsp:Transcript_67619/g.119927  ORF Transcript_67619/g.119927 Transcript_67619/m.119927 type:complete len:688 (-) Transcript_67619:2399-4462(-)